MECLLFDIGGTDLKYGVIRDGVILYDNKTPSDAHLGGNAILEKIIKISKELLKDYNPRGIAISTAGVVDTKTGTIIAAGNNIKDYVGTNIKGTLEKELGLETWVINDVNAVALSEINDGVASNYNSIICIAVGTGIGGGIIIENKLIEGKFYGAGEVGIMVTNKGIAWEKAASTKILVDNCKEIYPDIKNGEDVFEKYDAKDPKIVQIVDNFYNDLSIGIANLMYILNPEAIVIGGGITNRGDKFLTELKKKVKENVREYYYNNTEILISKNKNKAGMIGAYYNFLKTING